MLLCFSTKLLDVTESKKLETFWRTLAMDCEAFQNESLCDEVDEEVRPDWEFHLRNDAPGDSDEVQEAHREMLPEEWKFEKGRTIWYRNFGECTFCLSGQELYIRSGRRKGGRFDGSVGWRQGACHLARGAG